jgi:ATP-binding cassette, subfamily C (CFTR/MRP), member 1
MALKAILLVVEMVEKRNFLQPLYQFYPPEATSGIYNRWFFCWLNSLFMKGFRQLLFLGDLYQLDKHLTGSYLHQRFQQAWKNGMYGATRYV